MMLFHPHKKKLSPIAVSLDGNTVVNMAPINLSPAIARHGISARVMGGEGSVSVRLSGDNVIKLDAASDTALLAGIAGAGSHATYLRDISNGNATITHDGSIRHDQTRDTLSVAKVDLGSGSNSYESYEGMIGVKHQF